MTPAAYCAVEGVAGAIVDRLLHRRVVINTNGTQSSWSLPSFGPMRRMLASIAVLTCA
ncbi:MAG: hypothetical protein ACYCYB_11875 [Candidatus Dormibacteria bacterium]